MTRIGRRAAEELSDLLFRQGIEPDLGAELGIGWQTHGKCLGKIRLASDLQRDDQQEWETLESPGHIVQQGPGRRVHPPYVFDDPDDGPDLEGKSNEAGHFLVQTSAPCRRVNAILAVSCQVLEFRQEVADASEVLEFRGKLACYFGSNRSKPVDHRAVRYVRLGWIAAALQEPNILKCDGASKLAYEATLSYACFAGHQHSRGRGVPDLAHCFTKRFQLVLTPEKRCLELTQVVHPRLGRRGGAYPLHEEVSFL